MQVRRVRMFGIGIASALALGLWQTDTARADRWGGRGGSRGCGGSYYSTRYYSSGCAPVYVAPVYAAPVYVAPACYPARSYYYSNSGYCAPRSGFGFSFSYRGGRDRDCDRGFRSVRSRHGDYARYGRRGGRGRW